MKKYFEEFFIYLKLIIFVNLIIYTLEVQKDLLDNMVIFENTNGDIYLTRDIDSKILVFGTTLSNGEDRAFYCLSFEDGYFFHNNDGSSPFMIKNIGRSNNKEILNTEAGIIVDYEGEEKEFSIILIGTNNSYIELYSNDNSKDINLYNPSDFFYIDKNNIGISSLFFGFKIEYIYTTVTIFKDEPTKKYITIYKYEFEPSSEDETMIDYELTKNKTFNQIKGDYMSCFSYSHFSWYYISCFYLDINNNYNITFIFYDNYNDLIEKNTTTIGILSGNENNELYFMKGISVKQKKAVYAYYSGENNNIPTLVFKTIDTDNDFSVTDTYNEYPIVHLNGYNFNNGIKYNDMVFIESFDQYSHFYFISTNQEKDTIIIAYIVNYLNISTNKNELLIRYFTIKLKEYFNKYIFHGFKAIDIGEAESKLFGLAFDFCLNDECNNLDDKNGNAALLMLSYPNTTNNNISVDFIEYAFINNKKYIFVNLTEYCIINNNIFGYKFYEVIIFDMIDDYYNDYEELDGIEYYIGNNEEYLEHYYISPEEILRIDLTNYNFEEPYYNNIYVKYYLEIIPPSLTEFNDLVDSFDETYGDKTNEETFLNSIGIIKKSIISTYNLYIKYNLTTNCDDNNCTLCLKNDTNYCIVCKDDIYTIIDDNTYGKLKICQKIEITESFTETDLQSTNIVTTNIDTTNIATTNIDTTNIATTNIDTTYIATTTNTDELTNKIESTNIFESELSEFSYLINNKSNLINSDQFTNVYESTDNNQYKTDLISTIINKIEIEDLLNDKYNNIKLSNEEIKYIYEDLKEYIQDKYHGDNTIINTDNVKIQISTLEEQKNSKELSNIDLGECGNILKEKYCKSENDSLIILKFDIKPENEKSTYVEYEVYEPITKRKIDLNECSGINIVIDIPIELDSDIELMYDLLSNSGYNLFNGNSSFYNDICATYTTENGTDILISDRRMDIYQSTINISLCQEGCEFQSYDKESKKAKCDCPMQKEKINNIDLSSLKFDKNEMVKEFYEILENSNFRVLKCYKLLLKPKLFIKNIGGMTMTILLVLFIILMIIYISVSSKKINIYIQEILKYKFLNNDKNDINYINNEEKSKKKKNHAKFLDDKKKKNNKKKKNKKHKNKNQDINSKNEEINKNIHKSHTANININNEPPKKKKKRNHKNNQKYIESNIVSSANSKNIINTISLSKNIYTSKNTAFNLKNANCLTMKNDNNENSIEIYDNYDNNKEKTPSESLDIKTNINNNKQKNYLNDVNSNNNIKAKNQNSENNIINYKNENENQNLNDQEINSLDYEKALVLDKRTYFQYYFSLIKKKHLIIFTFFPSNDYNLMSLKISLFIVSFSLYFSINAFFFNDNTMHKIYEDKGVYNIIYQIPQILYSSVVSSIINILLKSLSLSEKDILKIKQEKDTKNTTQKAKSIEKCIKIKFVIFFVISLILMLFFWYFISCFCAVYTNTQIILFKDTLISFSLSMLYPFAINLIPGFFRIPALRDEKKDMKCLYSFSQIVALI